MYDYILKRRLERYYQKNSREKRFLNLKDIHTVLVLFDTAGFREASMCINRLEGLGKKLTVYAYQKKKDRRDYSGTRYHIISQKAAGKWFGNPMYTIAEKLKEETFDAVIDLTVRRNIPLEYLLAYASAPVKTGLKKNNFPQYDLSIINLPDAENIRVEELGRQILYYLDSIQSASASVRG
ncbi:MAG: hypothetical protein LBH19_12420 [Dysgonamonadaceae bacterium]|jgi:hypothetical protein|nr:hypothetical protein [Dysgonamonadaceae bacterium]